MSNNFKEQAAYDYLHNNKHIKKKLLNSIKKKWNRHNFDIDEERYNRKQLKEKYIKREISIGLDEYLDRYDN